MNTDFLLNMVRPYLPTITNKFLPQINKAIAESLDNEKVDDAEAVFMLNNQDGVVYLRTVWLNTEAQVVRSSEPQKLTEYLQSILDQAIK